MRQRSIYTKWFNRYHILKSQNWEWGRLLILEVILILMIRTRTSHVIGFFRAQLKRKEAKKPWEDIPKVKLIAMVCNKVKVLVHFFKQFTMVQTKAVVKNLSQTNWGNKILKQALRSNNMHPHSTRRNKNSSKLILRPKIETKNRN